MKEDFKKDLELIKLLSKVMSEENIFSLKYEKSDLKLNINKVSKIENFDQSQGTLSSKEKTEKFLDNKNINDQNENHPGALKAPMVGTAYSSPEPGKPPFIRLGDIVEKDQPLLIIEAMKVMNTITAKRNGKITYIGFEDGQPIEFEQLLLIIE